MTRWRAALTAWLVVAWVAVVLAGSAQAAHLDAAERELEFIERHYAIDLAPKLEWQRVVWSLVSDGAWHEEWGPAPQRRPRLVLVVNANRTGKSELGGMVLSAAANGRLPRFDGPGECWGAMPTLEDASLRVIRPKLARWVGEGAQFTPVEQNRSSTVLCRTPAGGRVHVKAYEQGRAAFQGSACDVILLDEQPPDAIVNECRARLVDREGLLLAFFTPLGGTNSLLREQLYAAWEESRRAMPKAQPCAVCGHQAPVRQWAEVAPGAWVFSAGMRDNARSLGGWLPDAEIDAGERDLVEQGRVREAKVRYHGEWLDISEDRVIPVDAWREYHGEPPADIRKTAWIDPAYSARTSSCRSSIAVAGISRDGLVYIVESDGGQWDPSERERRCLDVLARHGDPPCNVQRVGGDVEFANALNSALIRAGRRACVTPWPEKGMVPDKISRANRFAPMVQAGQCLIRPDMVEVKRQANLLSASYLKTGGAVDDIDAVMGAALRLVEDQGAYSHELAEGQYVRRPWEEDVETPEWAGESDPFGSLGEF